MTGNINSLASG